MAQKGSQVIMQYGNNPTYAASTTWTDIAEIIDITPPNIEADDIDASHMLSPNQMKEFLPGWGDGGEVELTVQYDKTRNAALYTLFRQPKGFRIMFADAPGPSGSKWGLDGYVKGLQNTVEREGVITADLKIKVTGTPVFVPAA
jgi:hypothetical protein